MQFPRRKRLVQNRVLNGLSLFEMAPVYFEGENGIKPTITRHYFDGVDLTDGLRARRGCCYRAIDIALEIVRVDTRHFVKVCLVTLNGGVSEHCHRVTR